VGWGWSAFKPRVPQSVRRAKAEKELRSLEKLGATIQPVKIEGRAIVRTFWGKAWCGHFEAMGDFVNRLPRGRTYVRNGSVCHLEIGPKAIRAKVIGSSIYEVEVAVKALPKARWNRAKRKCSGQIGSLVELLQGRLSDEVMVAVCDAREGLFPLRSEISFSCSCPDWAVMCKHVAAVLYGVGSRLDERPELLFLLRGVDHQELIAAEVASVAAVTTGAFSTARLAEDDLSAIFGIEIAEPGGASAVAGPAARTGGKAPKRGTNAKRTAAPGAPAARRPVAARAGKSAPKIGAGVFTGTKLAALRSRLGLTQAEMGALVGTSQPLISRWERSGRTRLVLRPACLKALMRLEPETPGQVRKRLKRLGR
jgi:uncharacterized Zn finger protein/DNA-binding transcriptional regulator YiaG